MTTVRRAIEHLRGYKPLDHVCMILWSPDDVIERAKERDPPLELTKEEADEIIDMMEDDHDASNGVSWDTIDCYLDDVEERHEKEKLDRIA